jgi:hypothetical protein
MQQHATAVNIAGMQQEALTESQAAGIDGRQASPVDRHAHATQNALDLLAAQDHGQFLFLGWTEQFQGGPASLEGVLEQEFDAAKGDGGGGAGDLFLQGQMEKVTTQFFFADLVRRFVKEASQTAHRAHVTGLGFGGVTVELHILKETDT